MMAVKQYKVARGGDGADKDGSTLALEYHRQFAKPNMPTHWMSIPKHP